MNKRDQMLTNFAISGGQHVIQAVEELLAERDRLQAIVDGADPERVTVSRSLVAHLEREAGLDEDCKRVPDDFWSLIEGLYDEALATWEYADSRMKYVTVQIPKVDLPTLHAAFAPAAIEETTDG